MQKTLPTPVIENIVMVEKAIDISFSCTLAGIPAVVSGTYFVDTNGFYPDEINGQTLEELTKQMGWDSYETEFALQEAFENR